MPRDKSDRDWPLRLRAIVEATRSILAYTDGMSYADFAGDRMTVDAVLHNVFVIGEASRHVPSAVEVRHPDLPWDGMKAGGDVVDQIFPADLLPRLWDTIQTTVPSLLPKLNVMLTEFDRQEPGGQSS